MAHVQGAGGVRRDVLQVDLALALGNLALAEVVLLGASRRHNALQDAFARRMLMKPGPAMSTEAIMSFSGRWSTMI